MKLLTIIFAVLFSLTLFARDRDRDVVGERDRDRDRDVVWCDNCNRYVSNIERDEDEKRDRDGVLARDRDRDGATRD